jgi:hypothetical protein
MRLNKFAIVNATLLMVVAYMLGGPIACGLVGVAIFGVQVYLYAKG